MTGQNVGFAGAVFLNGPASCRDSDPYSGREHIDFENFRTGSQIVRERRL